MEHEIEIKMGHQGHGGVVAPKRIYNAFPTPPWRPKVETEEVKCTYGCYWSSWWP